MESKAYELGNYPKASNIQALIAKSVFNVDSCEKLQPYLRYYARQCRQVTSVAMSNGAVFPLRTNAEMLDIIVAIRNATPRDDLIANLETNWCAAAEPLSFDPDIIQNAIDLAVRILTMIDVGNFSNVYTGREPITWTSGTLTEFLKAQGLFDALPKIPCDGIKLDTEFHVYNIELIAGLEVELTTNLCDHLLLQEDHNGRVVYIFHHAAFLQSHSTDPIVFPADFIEETLHTLGILFPKGSRKVERWYRGKAKQEDLDPTLLRCRHPKRRIEDYKYWRDRLVNLKEAFDEPGSRSLRQWWHDRRDATQWYTLWIAVFFTVFFGLAQTVIGILQLYKS
ncbi:hypothetical protein F4808DRAFT_421316 [Astrocystis sublimbata]|nr:hypothetical protein F4808DRAFT_421316 [Astrocystis sublimbata]